MGEKSVSLVKSAKAVSSSIFSYARSFECDIRSHAVISDAISVNFQTNRQNTLRKPQDDLNSVCLAGIFKSRIALFV